MWVLSFSSKDLDCPVKVFLVLLHTGDADIEAFYQSLLTGSGGDPAKATRTATKLLLRSDLT